LLLNAILIFLFENKMNSQEELVAKTLGKIKNWKKKVSLNFSEENPEKSFVSFERNKWFLEEVGGGGMKKVIFWQNIYLCESWKFK